MQNIEFEHLCNCHASKDSLNGIASQISWYPFVVPDAWEDKEGGSVELMSVSK